MDMGKGDRHAIFTKWDVDTQLFVFNFWPHSVACGILVPQPGIEPAPSALGAQSLNHWTGREGPQGCLFLFFFFWMEIFISGSQVCEKKNTFGLGYFSSTCFQEPGSPRGTEFSCLFLNTLNIASVLLDYLALSFLLICPLQCHSCLSWESNLIL